MQQLLARDACDVDSAMYGGGISIMWTVCSVTNISNELQQLRVRLKRGNTAALQGGLPDLTVKIKERFFLENMKMLLVVLVYFFYYLVASFFVFFLLM